MLNLSNAPILGPHSSNAPTVCFGASPNNSPNSYPPSIHISDDQHINTDDENDIDITDIKRMLLTFMVTWHHIV